MEFFLESGVCYRPKQIHTSNYGDLWMAIYDDGVWRNTGQELIHYPVEIEGTKASIFSIYHDNEGTLWLITHNLGLLKYNGNSFEKFKL